MVSSFARSFLLVLFAIRQANVVVGQDRVLDCTFTIESVTQTRVPCNLPISGFPPVSGSECLAFILHNNNATSTAWSCKETATCARETCAFCEVVDRSIQCHDLRAGTGMATSCVANREVRTQTLCNCRCHEYFYVVSEPKECFQLCGMNQ